MGLPAENMDKIRQGIRLLLDGLGEDPERNGLSDTPQRVAKLYADILDGNYIKLAPPTAFEPELYEGNVAVHHVPFYAFCEHHLLPFYGFVSIGYIPNNKLLGLSKLVRIFRHSCKKITIQERITQAAVDALNTQADPHGAICHVSATHMCMTLRGTKSPGSYTSTTAFSGEYEHDTELRQQFISEATSNRSM
jgi:GTP cyclohydrolase IA